MCPERQSVNVDLVNQSNSYIVHQVRATEGMLFHYSFFCSLLLVVCCEQNQLHGYFGKRHMAKIGLEEEWRQDEMEERQSGMVSEHFIYD